jgi:hypothetical protein
LKLPHCVSPGGCNSAIYSPMVCSTTRRAKPRDHEFATGPRAEGHCEEGSTGPVEILSLASALARVHRYNPTMCEGI